MDPRQDESLIVFFDLETATTSHVIVEFGAILVCPRTLLEKASYSTFVRPSDLSIITSGFESKGITRDAVACAPSFAEIARHIFDLLHGRIWAGHNIVEHDVPIIQKAFDEIHWQSPEPKRYIDTYPLLAETFGRRAGDMKLATIASYFQLGEQSHRSLEDVRMNLQVLKNCGAILLLESKFRNVLAIESWVSPDDVYIPSINVSLSPLYWNNPKIQIFHRDIELKLQCKRLNVRYGIWQRFVNYDGVPQLSFVVDAPPRLCEVLYVCDQQAQGLFRNSGSTSEWNDVVKTYNTVPTIRLRIRTVGNGNDAKWVTEVCVKKAATGDEEQLELNKVQELEHLFNPGDSIDALFSVDTFDYEQRAGIRLVAEKLVIHS